MEAFCPNLSNKKVKQEFGELVNLFNMDLAHLLWDRNNGHSLEKAPNGADSILFQLLLDITNNRDEAIKAKAKTYFSEFIDWFGDWQHNAEDASKALDENGEPKILWHGTENEFDTFEFDTTGERGGHFVHDPNAIFFTDTKEKAFKYRLSLTMPVYLNMRNPGYSSVKDGKYKTLAQYTQRENEIIRDDAYDSAIIERYDKEGDNHGMTPTTQWVVKDPNLVKSVFNSGGFSKQDNNIYSSKQDVDNTGNVVEPIQDVYKYIEEKINPIFKGSYYDFINRNGKLAYEQLKQNITEEFNKNFNHWKVKLGPNREHQLSAVIVRQLSEDQKDVEKWKKIIFDNVNNTSKFSEQDLNAVLTGLISQAKGMSAHMQGVINIISNALKGSQISFQVSDRGFDKNLAAKCVREWNGRYTIYINQNAFFVNTSGFSNRATQTILHELIHVATERALRNNEVLQKEAKALLAEVRSVFGEEARDYGLSDIYEFFAELSNQEFVEKLKSIKYKAKEKTTKILFRNSKTKTEYSVQIWQSLFDKIKAFVNKLARAAAYGLHKESQKYSGTAYEEAVRLFIESTFSTEAYASDKDGVEYSYGAISANNNTDVQNEIHRQLSILLNSYKRDRNKPQSAEKRQDKVFETINTIRTLSEELTIQEVLNMANEEIGCFNQADDGTLIKYLKDQRSKQNPYKDVTSDELVRMYKNTIAFYDNMVNEVLKSVTINGLTNQLTSNLIDKVRSGIQDAKTMWKEALDVVTDKLVDKWVEEDLIVDDSLGDNPAEVIKDYLHKNWFYDDINGVQKYIFSIGNAESPLIKLAFNQIQKAETNIAELADKMCFELAKAYNKVSKLLRTDPFWQKMFMEFDKNGIPTGNFIRPINYGQYKIDLDEFVLLLNQDFENKYGFHYIVDNITGEYFNSKTLENANEEEWISESDPNYNPNILQMPPFIEYQLAILRFKCTNANLRFIYDYYAERLSRPFDKAIDPNGSNHSYLDTHHGLSPNTLRKYNTIQSNINYYLRECTDPVTGKTYPERLTNPDSLAKLDLWYNELAKLSNAYYEDGTEKTGEDLKMAYELKAWQRWIEKSIERDTDYDLFDKELADYDTAIAATTPGTQEHLDAKIAKEIFLKYNASVAINPKLFEMIFGKGYDKDRFELKEALVARIQKSMLKQTTSGEMLIPHLKEVENNIRFFIDCKETDEALEKHGLKQKTTTKHKFSDYIEMADVMYITLGGEYLDANFNVTQDVDLAITYQLYLILKYTELAVQQGEIAGLMENGQPKQFYGMSRNDIEDYFFDLFTYESSYGERKPLSIFTYMNPLQDIVIGDDGKAFNTIIYKPKGRFVETATNPFLNQNYDATDYNIEQPKSSTYDNHKAYDKVRNDSNISQLYDLLLDYMQKGQENMGFKNNRFDYKLPKVQSSNDALLSGLYRNVKHNAKKKGLWRGIGSALAEQYFDYNANDRDLRSDVTISPDLTINQNIPNKYVGTLEDRHKYSYNVLLSVIKYAGAAIEYRYKNDILSDLQAIRYAQDPANRTSDAVDTQHNRELYDYMMSLSMYKTNRTDTKADRFANALRTVGTWKMLGLNFLSALNGLLDSTVSILRDATVGRYYSMSDLLRSSMYNMFTTPHNLLNMGNAIPNTKLGAFKHMLGVGKDTVEVSSQIGKNKLQNMTGRLSLGIYNIVDFCTNNVMLHSMLTSFRFYDGDVVPKGFYRLYDLLRAFVKAGHSKKEAWWAHSKGAYNTLYNAYSYRSGQLFLKPEFLQYVTTKIKSLLRNTFIARSSVNNGIAPSDGSPMYTRTILGKFVGAMRGWMISGLQERLAGRDDTSVRKFDRIVEESVKNGRLYQQVKFKRLPRTKEQLESRTSWNFGTGLPQPEIWNALVRSLLVFCHTLANVTSFGRHKTRNLSLSERFAIKTMLVNIGIILTMIGGYQHIDDWCNDVRPISISKESPYSPKEVIHSKLYKEWVRNAYIRTTNSRIQQDLPSSAYDVIKTATVMTSASESMISGPINTLLFGERADMLSDVSDNNKIIRQGKYRGYTKWESTWLKAAGPLNNIYTFDTYNGVSANTQYYAREFAWWLQAIGREYHPQKLRRANKSSRNSINNIDGIDINIDNIDF